jgi:membrane associated rhomboid family serine protease
MDANTTTDYTPAKGTMSSSFPSNESDASSNPLLKAVENWLERTPSVTRFLISIHAGTYVISWLMDYSLALSNIPHFTLTKLEMYRITLSPLVNTSIFSLALAVLSFSELAKRLETSLGSTAFASLCLLIGLASSSLFLIACWLFSFVDPTWMLASGSGMWIIYIGILAVQCANAPLDLRIRLCFVNVPVLYYPVAIHILMAVTGSGGGHLVGDSLSLGLGYAIGSNINLRSWLALRTRQWEETHPILLTLTTHCRGWIHGHAVEGTETGWTETESHESMLPLFRASDTNTGAAAVSNTPFGAALLGVSRNTGIPSGVSTDQTSSTAPPAGRTLGGATRRGNVDPRTARLQALEKKMDRNEP